jgi:hypothetical protein
MDDKLIFAISLVYKEDEEYKIEKVNAEKVGDYYQIKAVPAFACNIAFNDIIAAEEENGELFFDELIQPSGHSVVHIIIFKPEISASIYAILTSFGLKINYLLNNRYLAVDIPLNISYAEVKRFLSKEEESKNLDYREACLSQQHRVI